MQELGMQVATMQASHFFWALLVAAASMARADLYGNSPPPADAPPAFRVKGKVFPPQTTLCNDPTTQCYGQTLSCPQQCPEIRPADPSARACFVDCNNPKCEGGVCLHRKPNCNGNGAGCYDPRFIGGDGVVFYFHGEAGRHFALVSDAGLHINARFIGVRQSGRRRDFTWIQSLGMRFGRHALTLAATPAAEWDPSADHLAFSFDGEPVDVDVGHLSSWSPAAVADGGGRLQIERTGTVNGVMVTLPGVFQIMATAVPVTKEDDRVHRYGIPAGDCFAHLEMQFRFFRLTERVEGVLGQTYRPDFASPVKRGVPMPVMGGEDRYAASSLLAADCKSCIFSPDQAPAEAAHGMTGFAGAGAATLDCTGNGGGHAVVCRR